MKKTIAILVLIIVLILGGCSVKAPNTDYQNEYSLKNVTLLGIDGVNTSDFKISFRPSEKTDGVIAYLIGFSCKEVGEVKNYLDELTKDEIFGLGNSLNRAYVISDLSYADGIGNTLNSNQKDIVTGQKFSEPSTYYFYACTIGENGLLGIEKTARTVTRGAMANKLIFTKNENNITGSFASYEDNIIKQNIIFYSYEGYNKILEKTFAAADVSALVAQKKALAFGNKTETSFDFSLDELYDIDGNAYDAAKVYYVYVASFSAEKLIGVSYNDGLFITPDSAVKLTSIGTGKGYVFPNGGAATIDGSRKSIISKNQIMFNGINTPRIAIIGASSGSEAELCSYFNYDDSSAKSFINRFGAAGFEAVYIPLSIDNYKTVGNNKYFADLIESCHGVYFLGGDQYLCARAMTNDDGSYNLIGQAVINTYQKGGIIMGSSAGCHVVSNPCFQDGTSYLALLANGAEYVDITQFDSTTPMAKIDGNNIYYQSINVTEKAVGAKAIFDSHFDARGRLGRLIAVVRDTACDFGMGLDENTGLSVSQGVGSAIGTGSVTIVDMSEAVVNQGEYFEISNVKLHYLNGGDKFDFSIGKYTTTKTLLGNEKLFYEPLGGLDNMFGANYQTTRAIVAFAYSDETEHTYTITDEASDVVFEVTLRKGADTEIYYSSSKYTAVNSMTEYNIAGYTNLYISISVRR